MSRRKRQVDEEDFDEYALWDDRIRGFSHARLEDAAPENEDYGLGAGYLGRARQSPRSPSIAGDDEIRPSRRRAASPDDSDRGGERRGLRKVGDAYDPDDVFDEPFIFNEPGGVPSASLSVAVKNAMLSSVVVRDWCLYHSVAFDADAIVSGNFSFLRQQRVIDSDAVVRLNNLQLRGMIWCKASTAEPLPQALFVELVVVYDRVRTTLSGSLFNSSGAIAPFSWSDVFGPANNALTYPSVTGVDEAFFQFTNPETSSRFRILHRKIYKFDCLKYNFRFMDTSGTMANVDPLLDYVTNTNSYFRISGGGPSPEYDIRKDTVACVDEFVNLCGLPAHYRPGPTLGTAVDSEGAIYVGWRCSADEGYADFNIYLNTRINMSVPSTGVKFY